MLIPKWQAVLEDGSILNQGEGVSSHEFFLKNIKLREFRIVLPSFLRQCGKCGKQRPQPAKCLIRVHLDKHKRLIYRERPPIEMKLRGGLRKGGPLNPVTLVGWQQQLTQFKDAAGHHPNIQMVSVIDQVTHEVLVMDRFHSDVAVGSHPPQLIANELESGWQTRIDPDDPSQVVPSRSTTEQLEIDEEVARRKAIYDEQKLNEADDLKKVLSDSG